MGKLAQVERQVIGMERAFATLSVGVTIVWTLAVVISVSFGGSPLGIFQPGPLLFYVLPSAFPTFSVFIWLLIERKPNNFKLAGLVGAALSLSFLGIWWAYVGTDDGIGRTYVPFAAIPVFAGTIFAISAYFIGAKLAKSKDKT